MFKEKVLITGGAGFIGSHLTDDCVKQGYNVVVVDNLSSGIKENINPDAKFYHVDIRSEQLIDVMAKEKVDYVFHLAAQVDVQVSVDNPQLDTSVNVLGTFNVLEGCKRGHVKKVIFSSSAAVYGEPKYLPIDEKHPLEPTSLYGLNKKIGENYFPFYQREYGLDYVVLRYANVYGPRQRSDGEGGVVSIFINNFLNGKTVKIYGDGNQTRDFLYVDDVVSANLSALQYGCNRVVNVGTGIQTSINELYDYIGGHFNIHYKAAHYKEKPGDIRNNILSIKYVQSALNWKPKYSLAEGLQLMISREEYLQ